MGIAQKKRTSEGSFFAGHMDLPTEKGGIICGWGNLESLPPHWGSWRKAPAYREKGSCLRSRWPAWGVLFLCGFPILWEALSWLHKGKGVEKISSALLVSIAMAAVVGIGDGFAVSEVVVIMAFGDYLENRTQAKARRGLESLLQLVPVTGRLVSEGREKEVPVEMQWLRCGSSRRRERRSLRSVMKKDRLVYWDCPTSSGPACRLLYPVCLVLA